MYYVFMLIHIHLMFKTTKTSGSKNLKRTKLRRKVELPKIFSAWCFQFPTVWKNYSFHFCSESGPVSHSASNLCLGGNGGEETTQI
jgi:hypothetical protein